MEKILRTEAEVALDDATESCKAAADHYQSAASFAHGDLAEQFESLCRRRREWAQSLEEEIRRMGNLPSAPDADREAMDHLIARVQVALAHDERAAFLKKAVQVEEDLFFKAEAAARREDLPATARSLLGEIAREALATRDRLEGHVG